MTTHWKLWHHRRTQLTSRTAVNLHQHHHRQKQPYLNTELSFRHWRTARNRQQLPKIPFNLHHNRRHCNPGKKHRPRLRRPSKMERLHPAGRLSGSSHCTHLSHRLPSCRTTNPCTKWNRTSWRTSHLLHQPPERLLLCTRTATKLFRRKGRNFMAEIIAIKKKTLSLQPKIINTKNIYNYVLDIGISFKTGRCTLACN